MTQPYWTGAGGQQDTAWLFAWLGEDLLPGIAFPVKCSKSRDVDAKKAKGSDGVTLEDNGYTGAKVSITLHIYTPEQWAAWQAVRPKIDPQRPGGTRAPLDILHPEPNEAGVTQVYVKTIESDSPTAKGGKIIKLECIEWFPQPKPVKKAAGKKVNGQPVVAVTPFRTQFADGPQPPLAGTAALDRIFQGWTD